MMDKNHGTWGKMIRNDGKYITGSLPAFYVEKLTSSIRAAYVANNSSSTVFIGTCVIRLSQSHTIFWKLHITSSWLGITRCLLSTMMIPFFHQNTYKLIINIINRPFNLCALLKWHVNFQAVRPPFRLWQWFRTPLQIIVWYSCKVGENYKP